MSNYDPRQAYNDRKTKAAKAGDKRRAQSSHPNVGGNDNNYGK